MFIKCWGARGSIPISGKEFEKYGGDTTCMEIRSHYDDIIIIEIDDELCDGCGQCVPSCAEGAIQIIDEKARIVADNLCDGFGLAKIGEALLYKNIKLTNFQQEVINLIKQQL